MDLLLGISPQQIGFIFLIAALLVIVITLVVGFFLLRPPRALIQETPSDKLAYEEVEFSSRADELKLKGWYFAAGDANSKSTSNRSNNANLQDRETTIILAHGYGANRLQEGVSLELAEALLSQGYSVLLFDFRNSGESPGILTTLGDKEKQDLLGAVDFINKKTDPGHKIVLHGFSMGAAAAILAGAEEEKVKGVIADSPFADLKKYLNSNFTKWTRLPEIPFRFTVLNIVPPLAGIKPGRVSPGKVIKDYNKPLLFIHGKSDELIPREETLKLAEQLPDDRAEVRLIPDAGHVEGFFAARDDYLQAVLSYLADLAG